MPDQISECEFPWFVSPVNLFRGNTPDDFQGSQSNLFVIVKERTDSIYFHISPLTTYNLTHPQLRLTTCGKSSPVGGLLTAHVRAFQHFGFTTLIGLPAA